VRIWRISNRLALVGSYYRWFLLKSQGLKEPLRGLWGEGVVSNVVDGMPEVLRLASFGRRGPMAARKHPTEILVSNSFSIMVVGSLPMA
jgi:hypothetical protein